MAKNILVTGGSRGIGAATAGSRAKAGYASPSTMPRTRRAAEAWSTAIEAGGGEAFAVKGDVGSEADVLAMFEAVDKRLGRLDALVNNAGIVDRKARVDEMSAGAARAHDAHQRRSARSSAPARR